MLAEGSGRRRHPSVRFRTLLLLVILGALLISSVRGRADVAVPTDNGNASRTVTWWMNDTTAGMVADNVTSEASRAVLPWVHQSMWWNQSSDLQANGSLASGMTASPSGIGLWGNSSSAIASGSFSDDAPWDFANGSSENVTAQWNSTQQWGELRHASPANQSVWDNMDAVTANWTLASQGGVGGVLEVKQQPEQGSGMMGIRVITWAGSYMGALRISPTTFDWAAYDRLVLWVKMNASMAVGFNLTANAGTEHVGTANQSLVPGWQQIIIDLDQLGSASQRSALTQVTLRFNAAAVPTDTWFFIDYAQLGTAKVFNEGGSISQVLHKSNVTTPLPGSALLGFDWCLWNASGTLNYTALVNLTEGPSSSFSAELSTTPSSGWHAFSADVSSSTVAAGDYNLSFRLWANVNTTDAVNVTFMVDNVSLVFPDRQNGTYLSRPLTMGVASEYLVLSWTATTPSDTNVSLGIRTSNNSNPNSAAWSSWETVVGSGLPNLTVPGAIYFQLRAALGTANASRTPLLQSLGLATRHRAENGTLTSDRFSALGDFLSWSTFNATLNVPSMTSVQFYVLHGGNWTRVTVGGDLSFLQGPELEWRVNLTTSDGLQTPSVHAVQTTYEYQGAPVRLSVLLHGVAITGDSIVSMKVGDYESFTATVYDAGSHVIPSALAPLAWTTNDSKGTASSNGTYLAGSPGLHWVNVTVLNAALFLSIRVNVSAQAAQPVGPTGSILDLWPAFAVAAAAAIGFALYEFAIRRMFAIDDVFLIAKDGRLIIHNTRRMRADRDEDILSGMLTAIMAFLRDQDPEENGELKRFQVGGKTTLLERGEHVYLSAVYSGRVPGWAGRDLHRFMTDLEDRFGDAFARWSGSPEDLHGLKDYMQRFVTRVRYHGDSHARGTDN